MSSFTKPLVVKDNGDETFTLFTEFEYRVGSLSSNEIITVPAGFVTDFASVPRIFWSVLPPYGQYTGASVIHDWLYRTGGMNSHYTRIQCDNIFLEGMVVLGVPKWKRNVMHWAVSKFGNSSWKKYGCR